MDRRDEWHESESSVFDAAPASENEWNIDTAPLRSDGPAPEAAPTRPSGRVMVIGFRVIRL